MKKAENTYLAGNKIYLRLLEKKDINRRYLSWLNDSETTKFVEAGNFPNSIEELGEYYKRISSSRSDVMFAIVTRKGNIHIGNIKLGSINWIHRFGDLGIMIGEKKYWGMGYGQEACRLLLEYAFKRLNMNKVILGVYGNHKPAIRAYQKAGFKIEGRLKNMINFEGKFVDKVLMGITKKQFLGPECTKYCS